MGSYFGHDTRKGVIRDLVSGDQVLAHCVRGNILWTVEKSRRNAEDYIGCYVLLGPVKSKDMFDCGYKPLEESMHPYYFNCPIKYLDMAPEQCPEWREKVREFHAKRSAKLQIGRIMELNATFPKEVRLTSIKPLYGQDSTGFLWKLRRGLFTGRSWGSWEELRSESQA